MEDKYINQKIISVIIVSYNNPEILINCLNSIYKFNDIGNNLEIIVVENSESLNIYNLIKNTYKHVVIIKNKNMGFGQANNIGAKLAKGKYLIFLNPDTLLIEPIFLFTIKTFNNNENLSLFGLKLVNTNLKSNISIGFIDKHSMFYVFIIRILNKFSIFLSDMMYISGANLFIKKDEFVKAGMFDENIFMYSEESDLIKRIKKQGGKIGFFKSKKIIHLEGKTSNNLNTLLVRLNSAKYYSKKYNLDFNKQIKQELLNNKIKLYLYILFNKSKSKIFKNNIEILKRFML